MKKVKSTTQPRQNSIVANITQSSSSIDNITKSDLDKKAEELTQKFTKNIKYVTDKFELRIEEKEAKTTEILAIFMTLFTFISVNVSIFTKTKDLLTAIIFMLVMTLCSTFLLSFTLVVTSKNIPNRKTVIGLIFSLFCLALAAILISVTKINFQLNT